MYDGVKYFAYIIKVKIVTKINLRRLTFSVGKLAGHSPRPSK